MKICDVCKKETGNWAAVTIMFEYGSKYDGTTAVFCSDKCLKKYVNEKVK